MKLSALLLVLVFAIIGTLAVLQILSVDQAIDVAWKSAAVVLIFGVAFSLIMGSSKDNSD